VEVFINGRCNLTTNKEGLIVEVDLLHTTNVGSCVLIVSIPSRYDRCLYNC
jgi:hypothetical protein